MKHPWTSYRERAGYTQNHIASELNVSRSFIVKLEAALTNGTPNLKLMEQLSELYGVPVIELGTSYDKYIRDTRADFKTAHPSFKKVLGLDYKFSIHPLKYYRATLKLSQVGFCKGLCLHPGPVANYERNVQRGIPQDLIVASNEIGWDYAPLESAVTQWRINGYADSRRLSA